MEGYTHLAEIYGVRCYFNEYTNEMKGINWFNEKLIDFFIWLDTTFTFNDGFYIKIIKRL